MTTIVAVQKNGKICIGADSLTLYGSRKELQSKLVSGPDKLFCFEGMVFAATSHPSWNLIFKNYLKTCSSEDFCDIDRIFKTLCKMHTALKTKYYLTPKTTHDLFESSEYNFLLATKHGLFDIEWDRTIRKCISMAAIGSGEQYALGAMKACYPYFDDPKEIAFAGLKAAACFDVKTELPACMYYVTKDGVQKIENVSALTL